MCVLTCHGCRSRLQAKPGGIEALVTGKPLPYLTFKSLASRTAHGELIRKILNAGERDLQLTAKMESSGAGCAVRLLLSCTLRYCATLRIRLNRPAKLHT